MDIRMNAGYVIVDSISIDDVEFVLGVNTKVGGKFVTWRCSGGKDYYWGHYFDDLLAAKGDLLARAGEELEIALLNYEREKNRAKNKSDKMHEGQVR